MAPYAGIEGVGGGNGADYFNRPGHGEDSGDGFEDVGHRFEGDEEAAEQELGGDKDGHELDGLEFGAGEGAGEEAEGYAEEGVEKRED